MKQTNYKSFPVLYILMRSDLVSLNPGKAMAQASHASNAMVYEVKRSGNAKIQNLFSKWQSSTKQGFGTCLVLDVINEQNIKDIIHKMQKTSPNVVCDIILDTTYPIRDGDTTHYISLNTCGYAFFDKNDASLCKILEPFELYM